LHPPGSTAAGDRSALERAHNKAHPVSPGSMSSSLSTVVRETPEIKILKRWHDTRFNRNGNRTQRPAYRRIARSLYPLN
jgi:hypothetical protein